MSIWASKLDEFAKPAHKNVTLLIQNTTDNDIESLLDACMKDNRWCDKEIEKKNDIKILKYQKRGSFIPFQWIWINSPQVIECTLTSKVSGVQVDLESRYIPSQNILSLLVFFYAFPAIILFFDLFGNNRENLKIIINTFKKAFPNIRIIKDTNTVNNKNAVNKKISITSLLIVVLKIYFILVMLLVLYAIILFFIWIIQSYSYILSHKLY